MQFFKPVGFFFRIKEIVIGFGSLYRNFLFARTVGRCNGAVKETGTSF